MKKITTLFLITLLISSCNNEKQVNAIVFERKAKTTDSTIVKFAYIFKSQKTIDSFTVLSSKIIPDSFAVMLSKFNNKAILKEFK